MIIASSGSGAAVWVLVAVVVILVLLRALQIGAGHPAGHRRRGEATR